MKLSFFIPTYRKGISAYAAILNICALAGGDVEVVIRDNSGSAEKKEFLSQFASEHCRIHSVPYCTPYENLKEAVKLTRSEFVFGISDDDYFDPSALPALLEKTDRILDDPGYSGVAGDMVYSRRASTAVLKLASLDSADASDRFKNHLASGSNLLWFVHRRSRYLEAMSFVRSLPIEWAFHDSVFNLLMLVFGRYADIKRIIYYQDMTNLDALRQGDFALFDIYHVRAGLDRATYALESIIGFYEGCKVILESTFTAHLAVQEREQLSFTWRSYYYSCFRDTHMTRLVREQVSPPQPPLSPVQEAVNKLCDKWFAGHRVVLDELLQEIVDVFALSNPATAQAYYDHWSHFGCAEAREISAA
jgi:hypothetical protein